MRLLPIVVTALALAGATGSRASDPVPERRPLPPVMLWAWEHPQRLAFLDPSRVGVAALAATIELTPSGPRVRPRLQPLDVPAGTALVAVARVETRPGSRLDASAASRTAEAIASLAERPGVAGLQVDFEAVASERRFYAMLLKELRARMPAGLPLSITALASWCAGDRWLDDLPIDEAVPMLLRMGPEGPTIAARLAHGPASCEACEGSAGVSTDEPLPRLKPGARIWLFHRGPWTERGLAAALARLRERA